MATRTRTRKTTRTMGEGVHTLTHVPTGKTVLSRPLSPVQRTRANARLKKGWEWVDQNETE